ncbi:pyridoxamine 5'-phosphate oxidase family protein [Parvularcula maris]|uniref:Pyridoxamine 5'-phosphate oxidase family protein n=1 Tax=Parvularcula maris TaxID=2965077 RepID=A0A9X2RI55_9PROT|nr:pyridoxamine 5'-phosphate oxidase family protein [Parvularcula maris]MCQ8185685.1 pyridoxamine 5'-phosphate oxidase family protein [Parvularcula maris]
MGKTYDAIDERIEAFIGKQKMFFVATAPSGEGGHVNLSPKGYDAFAILGPNKVAYADLGGSGIETVAHLRQNGRITIMFCAFEGPANILRLYGQGRVIQHDEEGFGDAMKPFPNIERARNVVEIDVTRIADSCGWGVPFYSYEGERDQLARWAVKDPEDEWWQKRRAKNAESIDGLPGLK